MVPDILISKCFSDTAKQNRGYSCRKHKVSQRRGCFSIMCRLSYQLCKIVFTKIVFSLFRPELSRKFKLKFPVIMIDGIFVSKAMSTDLSLLSKIA